MLGNQKGAATIAFLFLGIAVSGGIGFSTRQVIEEKRSDARHERQVAELEAMLSEDKPNRAVASKKKALKSKKRFSKKRFKQQSLSQKQKKSNKRKGYTSRRLASESRAKFKKRNYSAKKKPKFYRRTSTQPKQLRSNKMATR